MKPPTRCAVVKTNSKDLVVLSIAVQDVPAPELEPLMFFGPGNSQSQTTSDKEYLEWIKLPPRECVIMECNGHGDLVFTETFGKNTFKTFSDAYIAIGPCAARTEYPAVFGCLLLDRLYLLVASEVALGASLPANGIIWKVLNTTWVPLDLPGVAPLKLETSDRSRLQEFREYSHTSGYYFAEGINLELPFPFSKRGGVSAPFLHCNWSSALATRMEYFGAKGCCTPLIRGFVGENIIPLHSGPSLHVLLLGRQNKRNPGPRFHGRGLNEHGAAGNEHFYEYVLWRVMNNGFVFTKHVFFRGTVPVRWTTTDTVEGKMSFNPKNVNSRTSQYFLDFFTNVKRNIQLECGGNTRSEPRVRCVSLLRRTPTHHEKELGDHFEEGVKNSLKAVGEAFPLSCLEIVHFDWLRISSTYGIEETVRHFWREAVAFLTSNAKEDDSMFSVGIINDSGEVARLMSQVTIAMLITLRLDPSAFQQISSPLPSLRKLEGEMFPTLETASPPLPSPYADSWSDVISGKSISATLVRTLAKLFTANGDCVSRLYTNSPAMHGDILRGISGDGGGTHNAMIGIKRFYENNFEDNKKYRNLLLLLGEKRCFFFSPSCYAYLTLPVPYKQWPAAVKCTGIAPQTTIGDIRQEVYALLHLNSTSSNHLPPTRIELQSESDTGGPSQAIIDRVAVVLFLNNASHAVQLCQHGYIRLHALNCTIEPYHYAIEKQGAHNDGKGVAKTMSDGFRMLMRTIN